MNNNPIVPIGAVDLIVECQQMLAGKRREFTSLLAYTAQRRRYWEMQTQRPRRQRPAAANKRAA